MRFRIHRQSFGRRLAILTALAAGSLLAAGPGAALAAEPEARMLTYMPTELIYSLRPAAQIESVLAELDEYDIGQALLQLPRLKGNGALVLPESERTMLGVWASASANYDSAHAAHVSPTAVFNAVPKGRHLNLELAATRAQIVADVESVIATGIGGIQLDVEPYPTGPGYLALLEEIDAAFARLGYGGTLSVVAPANTARWPAEYLHRISELVDQLNPTFYDSEATTPVEYEQFVEAGLSYYTSAASEHATIIPVIPCFSPDPWHDPFVENVPNATSALAAALARGDRVQGAGVWWWYSFYDGHYKKGPSAASERSAWLTQTIDLPFSQ